MNSENKIYTAKELATRLGIGRDKTYALMRSLGFPSVQIGARYVVTEEALSRWLREAEGHKYDIEKGVLN